MKVPARERVEVSQKSHAWDQLTSDCILIFKPPLSLSQTSRQFNSHHADVSCLGFWRQTPGPESRGARESDVSGGRTEHVESGPQIIVRVWSAHERVSSAIGVWVKWWFVLRGRHGLGRSQPLRRRLGKEVSRCCPSWLRLALACRCTAPIWAVTVSFRDLRSLTRVSFISPPGQTTYKQQQQR